MAPRLSSAKQQASRAHAGNAKVCVKAQGFSWVGEIEFFRGKASFHVPFGDDASDYDITVTDVATEAVLSVAIPVLPVGSVLCRAELGSDRDSGDESEENLDEFEDDGFIVHSEEDAEDGDEGGDSSEGATPTGLQPEVCMKCCKGTSGCDEPVLICEGCECEVHLTCSALDAVPDGDYYCTICDGTAYGGGGDSAPAKEGEDGNDGGDLDFGDEDESEIEESVGEGSDKEEEEEMNQANSRAKRARGKSRALESDSDSD